MRMMVYGSMEMTGGDKGVAEHVKQHFRHDVKSIVPTLVRELHLSLAWGLGAFN